MNTSTSPGFIKWSIVAALGASGCLLYYFQNYAHALGGGIAIPKVFWLAYVLWFWYFLPLLLGCDRRLSRQLRLAYWIFWANMLLRAIAELWMMYVSQNWHPYWGIAHDFFSATLVALLWFKIPKTNSLDGIGCLNLQVTGAMFSIEAYFAWYMLSHVPSDNGPVYFVPGNGEHVTIMFLTWLVVMVLTVQQFFLARKWLYA
ncbi:MAG: hypothetical protein GDA56_00770 [Hormoscilla sp. GM7CHS1pb]|nr:hypothetical protein [Hormoscilla sp. GM7CHS1pb]